MPEAKSRRKGTKKSRIAPPQPSSCSQPHIKKQRERYETLRKSREAQRKDECRRHDAITIRESRSDDAVRSPRWSEAQPGERSDDAVVRGKVRRYLSCPTCPTRPTHFAPRTYR